MLVWTGAEDLSEFMEVQRFYLSGNVDMQIVGIMNHLHSIYQSLRFIKYM